MKGRLNALRRTKLYDLFAAAPVIAWFAFSVTQMLPSLAQRVELVMLFVRTDPSVLPATLVFRTLSEVGTLVFFALSIVMYIGALHSAAGRARILSTLCCCGRHLFEPRIPAAAAARAVVFALPGIASLADRRHHFRNLRAGCSRAFDQPPAGGPTTGNQGPYALVRHPLYLGEMVAIAGVALQHLSAWALLLLALGWAFQLQRMKYEERVLFQSFPEYGDYMARTARLVPGVY